MSKTVLIILAAVVAMIVIVICLGLRYLRAEDEDEFEDGLDAERGRSGTYDSHHPRREARSRRFDDDDMAERQRRERPVVAQVGAGRSGAERATDQRTDRPVAGRMRHDRPPSDRGSDRIASSRGGSRAAMQDRGQRDRERGEAGSWRTGSWGDDTGATQPRGGAPHRASRDGRGLGGHRDQDAISEPLRVIARGGVAEPGRGGHRGPEDLDARASQSLSARDLSRDFGSERDRTERMDAPDRRDNVLGREARQQRAVRSSSDSSSGVRDGSGVDREDRDRRGSTRPGARQEGRKNGNGQERDEVLPAVKPRQGRSRRDGDGEWPSNEWDELSDVDYWAELASDKPLGASPAAEPSARADFAASDRSESFRSDPGGSDGGHRGDRDRTKPGRAPREGRRSGQELNLPAAAAAPGSADSVPGWPNGSLPGSRPSQAPRRQPPADDDPLTSPSFPRITSDDSRSYRRSRQAPSESSGSRSAETASARLAPAGARATDDYPLMPSLEPIRGADYARPSADQYRSVPASDSLPGSYRTPAVASGQYQGVTAEYSLPSQPGSAGYQAPDGYPGRAGSAHNGYNRAAAGSGFVPAGPGAPGLPYDGYSTESATRPGYQPAAPDSGYQDSAYQGAGYADAGTRADLPGYGEAQPGLPGGYPDYGGISSSSGSHLRPEPGVPSGGYPSGTYPSGGYQSGAYPTSEAHGHRSPPAALGEPDYPSYQAPVTVGPAGPYPSAATPLYGLGPVYHDHQAPAGQYDAVGYQAPAQPGYAGADPYAADPYRPTGYGSGGY